MFLSEDQPPNLKDVFYLSWLEVETFYASIIIFNNYTSVIPLYTLAHNLRMSPYSRNLQAGTIVNSFVLSRSVRHGLNPRQHYLQFDTDQKQYIAKYYDGSSITETRIDIQTDRRLWIPDALKVLLHRLIDEPLD